MDDSLSTILTTIIVFICGGGGIAIFNRIWSSTEATIHVERERNAVIVPALDNITETLEHMQDAISTIETDRDGQRDILKELADQVGEIGGEVQEISRALQDTPDLRRLEGER